MHLIASLKPVTCWLRSSCRRWNEKVCVLSGDANQCQLPKPNPCEHKISGCDTVFRITTVPSLKSFRSG